MQHDSFSPVSVFPVHPPVGAHSLLDPPREVLLCGPRQRDWFGRWRTLRYRLWAQRLHQGERPCGRTDMNFQRSSACAVLSTILARVMQLLLFSPRSTMRRSWTWWHHTVQSAGSSKCGRTRNLSPGKRKILDDAHHRSDHTFGNPIACFSHRRTGNGHWTQRSTIDRDKDISSACDQVDKSKGPRKLWLMFMSGKNNWTSRIIRQVGRAADGFSINSFHSRLYGIGGQPIDFEWNLFQGLTSLELLRKIYGDLQRRNIDPENLEIDLSSCPCPTTLIA